MAIIGMRELLRDPKKVFSNVEESGEPVLVTNRGRPVAALYPVDAERAEELMLESAPEYLASRRQAENARSQGRTRSLDEAVAEYNEGVEAGDRIEPDDTDTTLLDQPIAGLGASVWAQPVPVAELQAIFGAKLGEEVANQAHLRVAHISESLVDSAEAAGLLAFDPAKTTAGVDDREKVVRRVMELSAQLLGRLMLENLLSAARSRMSALESETAAAASGSDPDGMFGRRLAEETLDTAASNVEQFNGEVLSLGSVFGAGGLLSTYDASIKAASAFGLGRASHTGAAPVVRDQGAAPGMRQH
jgi:prevent-host-death family protein